MWHRAGYGPVSRPALTPQSHTYAAIAALESDAIWLGGRGRGGTSQKPDLEHTDTISTTIRARRTSQSAMKPRSSAFCGAVAESNRRENDHHRASETIAFEARPPHFRDEKWPSIVDCPHLGPGIGNSATARLTQ